MRIRHLCLVLLTPALLCQCQSYKPDFAATDKGVRAADSKQWQQAVVAIREHARAVGTDAVVVAHTY